MAVRNRLIALIGEKQTQTNKTVTQIEVARALGLSRQALSRWMQNDVRSYPADTLDKMCQFFDCTVGDILIYEPDKE